MKVRVCLVDVRSNYNVGAIFRSCDGAGVQHLYVAGYTPSPVDRFGREQREIAKTALGAQKMVHWTQVKAVPALLRKLKKEGWRIVAVEQCGRSVSFKKYKPRAKTLYIFGNEISGVPEKVLKLCDDVIDIPMSGKKESLNVSVAAGVILFNVSTEPKNESKAY